MATNGALRESRQLSDMEFQLAVLEDASAQADLFWCTALWRREQPNFHPSERLLDYAASRQIDEIRSVWNGWFAVLTSWEFAHALIGRDVRVHIDSP